MYCLKCGHKNEKEYAFCANCGEKLTDISANQVDLSAQNNKSCNITGNKDICRNTVIEDIKKFVTSPIVLGAITLFTLFILSFIIGAGNIVTDIFEEIGGWFGVRDVEDFVEYEWGLELGLINSIFRIIALLVMIPNIAICIGLWITVYSAFDKHSKTISVTGLKIVKVLNIIDIVLSSIYFAFGLIRNVIVLVRYIYWCIEEYYSVVVVIPTLFSTIMGIGFFILRILYIVKVNKTINSFIFSVKQERIVKGASKFVAVMLIIFSVIQCVIGLVGISTFPIICSAGANILFALTIIRYKNMCESK